MARAKPDFTIRPGAVIWRHGRTFKAGQEAELVAAGFPEDAKRAKAASGQIVLSDTATAEKAAAKPAEKKATVKAEAKPAEKKAPAKAEPKADEVK